MDSTPRRSKRASISTPHLIHRGLVLAAATIASASKPATARPASKKRTRDSNSTNDDGGSGDDIADGAKAKSGAKANPSAKPSASAKVKAMVVKKQRILKVGMNPLATLHLDPLVVRCAFVFGEGGFGQHGLGPDRTDEIKKPRLHSGFEKMISEGDAWSMGVARVATGGMHTLAIDGQGRVFSWGINDNAALGRRTVDVPGIEDSDELETVPMIVQGLPDTFKAVQVAAGDGHSIAISDRGELRCWGSFRNSTGLLGFSNHSMQQLLPITYDTLASDPIVQVASGTDHYVALTTDGTVFTCGDGEQSQLGRRIVVGRNLHGLKPERLGLRKIVLVGAGSYHSFAVAHDGTVLAWGLNSFRQLGIADDDGGSADAVIMPTRVAALHPSLHGGARVIRIEGGEHHSLFLFSNGEVWACGRCDGHEVGLPDAHPEMVALAERTAAVEALRLARARAVELATLAEFAAESGKEEDKIEKTEATRAAAAAQLERQKKEAVEKGERISKNDLPLPTPCIALPTRITFTSTTATAAEAEDTSREIVDIAAGTRHNLAVSSGGELFAWGVGESSQLGLGAEETEAHSPTPVVSVAMTGFKVVSARTGGQHAIALAIRTDKAKSSVFTKVAAPGTVQLKAAAGGTHMQVHALGSIRENGIMAMEQ